MDIVYLDFHKAFIIASHKILIDNLMNYGLDEKTVRWIINWHNGWAQRVMISAVKSESSNEQFIPRGSILGAVPFNISVNDLDDGAEHGLSKFETHTKLGGYVLPSRGMSGWRNGLT